MVNDYMANAMKKPAKSLIIFTKKVKPIATKAAARYSTVKPTKTMVIKSLSKTAGKSPGGGIAPGNKKLAPKVAFNAAPKAVPKAAATPTKKSASRTVAQPVSVKSKAPVTNKKPVLKVVKSPKNIVPEAVVQKDMSVMIGSGVSQTTDAATLAAIDTSSYILPSVKVPGRRGRKPKEFQPENDEIAALNAVERAELKAFDKAKAKDRKAKEKALLKDAFSSDTEASEEELEARRQKLKTLIKMGKERGFLTYSEINNHLPENIIDPEAIEGI
ncbi:MAG: RNA polymerase sigma factor region1.1 domain-containing protein, partial [Glaciimonas sp.]|nr:RNA polymerase sigma factor region1.1 domain-containing protein [Glaciimonas sp.]